MRPGQPVEDRPCVFSGSVIAGRGKFRFREQRRIEERKLAFLGLKLQVLKAENERLKKRTAGGEQPSPYPRDFEALLNASRETASEVSRRNLSRPVQGGLPSLGTDR